MRDHPRAGRVPPPRNERGRPWRARSPKWKTASAPSSTPRRTAWARWSASSPGSAPAWPMSSSRHSRSRPAGSSSSSGSAASRRGSRLRETPRSRPAGAGEVIDRNGLTPVLERIRDEFEANDWNGRRSRFDDSLDINALLLGYLADSHSSGHVHRLLGHHQHFLPVGDGFGSAGTFGSGGGFGGSSFGGFGGGEGGFPPGAGSSPAARGRLRASTESGDVSGIPATPNRLGASHGTFPDVIQ